MLRLSSGIGAAFAAWAFSSVAPTAALAQAPPMRFSGEITVASVKSMTEAPLSDTRTLLIDSPGGDVLAALALAHWIVRPGLSVEATGLCASSGANYVFPAGRRKRLGDGGLLIWHGGAYQADFERFAVGHEAAVLRRMWESPMPGDARLLQGGERYENLRSLQGAGRQLLSSLAVDPRLPTIGHCEPAATGRGWTLTMEAMSLLGIAPVDAPRGCGSAAYVDRWMRSMGRVGPTYPRGADITVLDAGEVARRLSGCPGPAAPDPAQWLP